MVRDFTLSHNAQGLLVPVDDIRTHAQTNRGGTEEALAALKNAQAAPPKPKRKLSAAGRRAIIEATKKRWAAIRAAKAKAARKPKASKAAKSRKLAAQATPTA